MNGRFSTAIRQIAILLAVICIGTIFDWFAHRTSPQFDVPSSYFRNKILFGTLIGFIALRIFSRFVKNTGWLAFAVTLTVAILLQVRYSLEGYDPFFVFLFLGIHFVVFFVPALLLFRRYRNILAL